ncbi:hypothetical protein AB0I55_23785 [Actinocatenispora sera]|uniref:hypothetical protein n=1 Tax=Actinocatenispora sera TaxID=390989 RepID=UPI0033D2D490
MTAAADPRETATLPGIGARARPATVLTALGGGCVVLGGLVAAVTAPLSLAHGSWLAAYLVLVCGVAQWAMGRARARSGTSGPRRAWTQVVAWNLGNAVVIAATLLGRPALVDLGSVLLVAALVIALFAAPARGATGLALLACWAYRALLVVLAVSIPVGILLSYLRHA